MMYLREVITLTDNSLPKITLFMLMSVDGKISTGIGNGRDFDVDLPKDIWNVRGIKSVL